MTDRFPKGIAERLKTCMRTFKSNLKIGLQMGEINKTNIPAFNELSISKLGNHIKSNPTVMKYMPDYVSKQQSEREFIFNMLGTLYPTEVDKMVDAAYKARKTHHKQNEDDLIELTQEMKKAIQSAIVYQSK